MKSRPTKQKLKQRGILRERVFGCDLGEHLLNSAHDVPQVLRSCTEFIEKHGVVDGMYRLSGIASNIQKLRHEFDSEQIPDLTRDVYIQDIHCVGSLCKLYFRELPNPLLTYQLYEKFSEAVSAATDEERLIKIHDVIQQLPPPHYRTLEFLMRHLSHLATFSYITNMHSKNLAIVWAPNLLRSKQIESACFSGTAAFMEVRIQSVVVEFILNHVDVLFSPRLSSLIREGAGHNSLSRPKSLLVSSPSTKLLTLEEAQARTQAQINSPVTADSKYIEVGEGPAALQGKFHTVIEFPTERKRPPVKSRKSPVGSWRSFFNLGKSSSMSKRKLQRNPSEPSELKAMALAGGRGDTGTLRSAKSEESLTSLHNVEGESKVYRPRRPRSSSDALSASFNGDLLDDRRPHCDSYDNLGGESDDDDGPIRVPALISPPRSAGEEVDLSPPDIGMATLDFDPMSFQCSLPDASFSFPLGGDSSPSPSPSSSAAAGDGAGPKRSPPGRADPADPASPHASLGLVGRFAGPFLCAEPGERTESRKLSSSYSYMERPVQAVSPIKSAARSVSLAPLAVSEPFSEFPGKDPPESAAPATSAPRDLAGLAGSLLLPPPGTGEPSPSPAFRTELHCKLTADDDAHDFLGGGGGGGGGEGAQPTVVTPGREQPGAVALDPPWDPAPPDPLSSPAFPPPPPPPLKKNVARPPALAESSQQASSSLHHRGAPDPLDWPPPPAAQTPSEEAAPSPPDTAAPDDQQQPPPESARPPGTTPGQEADVTPSATPHLRCDPPPPAARGSPPARTSPARQQPAVGQVPISAGPSTAPQVQNVENVRPPTLPKPSEHPVAVLQPQPQKQPQIQPPSQPLKQPQPQTQPQTQPQPQPQTEPPPPAQNQAPPPTQPQPQTQPHPQPNARAAPTPAAESALDKPWEAITPVQPVPTPHHPPYRAHSPTPPAPPVRSIESKLAAAALSQTEAAGLHAAPAEEEEAAPPYPPARRSSTHQATHLYHSKGEASSPEPPAVGEAYYHQQRGGVGVALPAAPLYHYRPDAAAAHLAYASKSEPQLPYSVRVSDARYHTLGPRSYHQSAKSRALGPPPRGAEYVSLGAGHRGGYAVPDAAPHHIYPSIRRVHSLHAPSAVRSAPVQRTEVPPPPDDELFYYQRPVYGCKAYQPPPPPPQADYHVTQLQPYFENGRVQYRYSPYSGGGGGPLDAPYYDVDPYGTIRLRHIHSFSSRDPGPRDLSRSGGKAGGYHFLSRHHHAPLLLPPGKEHSFVSRDMPPGHHGAAKGGGASGAAVYFAWEPPPEEAEPYRAHSVRRESRARQKMKTPVMSQYDNVGLFVSPAAADAAPSGYETLHLRSKSDPGKAALMAAEGKEGRYGAQHHHPASSSSRHPPPADADTLVYMETEKHCQGNGTGDKQGGARTCQAPPLTRSLSHQQDGDGCGAMHWQQEHADARGFQPRYERPDLDRHPSRVKTTSGYHDAEDPPPAKAAAPPKPERAGRERQHFQPTPDPEREYAYQRHSTMTVQSHYDNLDHYPAAPQAPPRGGGGAGPFPTPGLAVAHGNRAYATALGQGAFVQAELALQRADTEIHAE